MLHHEALGQIQSVLNDVDGAIRYVVDAERSHPNRIDICAQAGSRFGQPSLLGMTGSSFGQPSQLRPRSTLFNANVEHSAGSQPGQPTTGAQAGNPFGTSTQTAGGGVGRPLVLPNTPLGQHQASRSEPGRPSEMGQPRFGRPSMTGVDLVPGVGPSDQANPFGGASPSPGNPFGQPARPAPANPFTR